MIQMNKEGPQVMPNKSWTILPYSLPSAPYTLTKCTGQVKMCCSAKDSTKIPLLHSDLIKIFCRCPHFFPGLVQQLDADGK